MFRDPGGLALEKGSAFLYSFLLGSFLIYTYYIQSCYVHIIFNFIVFILRIIIVIIIIHIYNHSCLYSYFHLSPSHLSLCIIVIYQLFLLAAPSRCMPSHPTRFPAFSSTPPYPCWLASLFADAAFIASTACDLSCSPEDFHASLPVTLPIVSCASVSHEQANTTNSPIFQTPRLIPQQRP